MAFQSLLCFNKHQGIPCNHMRSIYKVWPESPRFSFFTQSGIKSFQKAVNVTKHFAITYPLTPQFKGKVNTIEMGGRVLGL